MQKMTDLNAILKILVQIERNETEQFETIKKNLRRESERTVRSGNGRRQARREKVNLTNPTP